MGAVIQAAAWWLLRWAGPTAFLGWIAGGIAAGQTGWTVIAGAVAIAAAVVSGIVRGIEESDKDPVGS